MGNIGKIGTPALSENKDKMKLFVEKYLQLAASSNDQRAQMEGSLKLAVISTAKRNFQEGKDHFRRALELAQNSDPQVYNEAKFGFAVVAAQKNMNNYLGAYCSKIGRKTAS